MVDVITKPGVHALDEASYHADPCPTPSLSSSIGKILLERSPRHAWTAHPRLNPDHESEEKTTFDLGNAAHSMILGSNVPFEIIDAPNWTTKDARTARDAARDEGKIPILTKDYLRTVAMTKAARLQLASHRDANDAFTGGKPEQAIIWQEGAIWCRIRLDWLADDWSRPFDDLKSTGVSANPDAFERTLFNLGYDFQAAFYRRGIRKVLGVPAPRFRFVVVENEPPYGLSVIELAPAAIELADRRVQRAIDMWSWCLEHDKWPAYPAETVFVDIPPYLETKQLEREDREVLVKQKTGQDARELLNLYHSPLGAAE